MLIGSFFFAAMSLFTESLGGTYTFTWIAFVRSAIATIVAMAMVWLGGAKFVFLRPWTLWWRSLAGCLSMMFLFYAMTHYHVEVILSLSSTYPIWVAVLGWPLLGQRPSMNTWIALIVSTVGMWLVYSTSVRAEGAAIYPQHFSPHYAIPSGALAGLLSAVALIGLHKVKEVDPRAVVAHFSGVSTIIAFVIWGLVPVPSASDVNSLLSLSGLLGVGVAAVLGQLFLTKAFASGVPARVSVIGLTQVVFASLYKWLIFGSVPTPLSLVGMLLVLSATLYVMLLNATDPAVE